MTKADKQGALMIAGVAGVLAVVFALKFRIDQRPQPDQFNCAGAVRVNTVILVDHSEQITQQTAGEIVERAMSHIADHVQTNERVSLFTISSLSSQRLKPVVSLCKPPTDGNRLIENVGIIRRRYAERFEKPLRQAIGSSITHSKESPLAQAITDVSLSHYLRGDLNRLLIFSDLLENTPRFSLYTCRDESNAVAQYRESRRGALERPTFRNTIVQLNIVPRFDLPKPVLHCRDKFWLWFFGDNSGAEARVDVDYLPGGRASTEPSTDSAR